MSSLFYGAAGENRTPNLFITNELPYHSATAALVVLGLGIDPRLRAPQTRVLPLHYPSKLFFSIGQL